jgi:hypothetical protein
MGCRHARHDPRGADVTRLATWTRGLLGLFVTDRFLTLFVPLWITFAWLCRPGWTHIPPGLFATLLACGPIAALWWSVRHAASVLRRSESNPQ